MQDKILESDKELMKRAGIASVDAIVVAIDTTLGGTPLVSGAWGLTKALIGNGIALRQKKAIEWVEMIRDNPTIFTKDVVSTEEFQDAFVISLENYIRERNESKRKILREIFKSYSCSQHPVLYPLERLNELTKQITLYDAETFEYLVRLSKEYETGRSFRDTRESPSRHESILHLISLGLLIHDDRARMATDKPGVPTPYILISGLGSHYYQFISNADLTNKKEGYE